MKVIFFPNGNTIVFENGKQVPELQQSWLLLYVKMLTEQGIDPTTVEFVLPDTRHADVFRLDGGRFNWDIRD